MLELNSPRKYAIDPNSFEEENTSLEASQESHVEAALHAHVVVHVPAL